MTTLQSKLTLAALASAAMPSIAVAGVRDVHQTNETDEAAGIAFAVVQDTRGRFYDVYAARSEEGRKRLAERAQASQTLAGTRGPNGLGFSVDDISAFEPGGDESVLVAPHVNGESRSLDLLTFEDCASAGTAIGAIHRLNPDFLESGGYATFTTDEIRIQLTTWIERLQRAGHIPQAITSSWAKVINTDGLWMFSTCLVHGGFNDGDFVFSGSTINAVTNWQSMQLNDPARDLAWIFSKLDEEHRNQLMSAYGHMMGSRVDDLIMLRANLWMQMEQVGEFIEALSRADSRQISKFKAQVEKLAHELTVLTNRNEAKASAEREARQAKAAAEAARRQASEQAQAQARQEQSDETFDGDYTQDEDIVSDNTLDEDNTFDDVPVSDDTFDNDNTHDEDIVSDNTLDEDNTFSAERPASSGTQRPNPGSKANSPSYKDMPDPSSSATVVMAAGTVSAGNESQTIDQPAPDNAVHAAAANDHSTHKTTRDSGLPPTLFIPKLEQEQQALRDAQEGLDEYESRKFAQTPQPGSSASNEPDAEDDTNSSFHFSDITFDHTAGSDDTTDNKRTE